MLCDGGGLLRLICFSLLNVLFSVVGSIVMLMFCVYRCVWVLWLLLVKVILVLGRCCFI